MAAQVQGYGGPEASDGATHDRFRRALDFFDPVFACRAPSEAGAATGLNQRPVSWEGANCL